MRSFVIDTNSLLQILPKKSPYRHIWNDYLSGRFTLCVTTEILAEYEEILSQNITPSIAENVVSLIAGRNNTLLITPYYRFRLIQTDPDDNKFVDCAICANASFIVTEDHHFDALAYIDYPKVEVINLDQYTAVMNN